MGEKDLSLSSILMLMSPGPAKRALLWQLTNRHEDRLEILEEAVDDCYKKLVDSRGLNMHCGEDQLSVQVANMLCSAGISAKHDQHVNGHCDIVVEAEGFMWLAEAKVHGGYGWLRDGFLQLSTRYGTAMFGRDHGELIIYNRSGDALHVLSTWKSKLSTYHPEVEITEDISAPKLFFRTKHTCQNSGCKFSVRHSVVPLAHAPKK